MKIIPVKGTEGAPLPVKEDFDPFAGNLDAQDAWRNFGGLTLEKAYARFCENPFNYQEDFMFMGRPAFHYYFPVIDAYLRNVKTTGDGDDCQAHILAGGILLQLGSSAEIPGELKNRILELCTFVRSHLDNFARLPEERAKIEQAWRTVKSALY